MRLVRLKSPVISWIDMLPSPFARYVLSLFFFSRLVIKVYGHIHFCCHLERVSLRVYFTFKMSFSLETASISETDKLFTLLGKMHSILGYFFNFGLMYFFFCQLDFSTNDSWMSVFTFIVCAVNLLISQGFGAIAWWYSNTSALKEPRRNCTDNVNHLFREVQDEFLGGLQAIQSTLQIFSRWKISGNLKYQFMLLLLWSTVSSLDM